MTSEQYRRLAELFHEAMARAETQRENFAHALSGSDAELCPLLLKLIRSAGRSTASETAVAAFEVDGYIPSFSPNEILLHRFRIVRFLGRGGMGEVYEADDADTGRVALKTIRPEIAEHANALARLRQEVRYARKVTGPNVCRIHEFFSLPASSGRPATAFLTMEFLEGITRADRIDVGPPLSVDEAEKIAVEICRGLQTIHEADVIHRDLKSRNIMLAVRKRGVEAVLMDFGLARETPRALAAAVHPGSTVAGAVVGTPEYMAPEQFRGGKLSPATDIYALGIVLYEMATGKLPYGGPVPLAAAVERAKRVKPVSAFRKDLPHRWDTTIERCLRYAPEERFQSAEEVVKALADRLLWPRAPASLIRAAAIPLAALFIAASLLWYHAATSHGGSGPKRIAVLPFDDLSHDPNDQAFCDGLSEVFVAQLTELEQFQNELSVVPSSEVRHEHIATARDAYRAFGVNLVLTGSVQRSSSYLRVFVNMVDAKHLRQIRSKSMMIAESDPVAMQSGVVSQVANLLDVQLNSKAHRLLTAGATTVPGAYEFYLQGAGYLLNGRVGVDQAITEFQHALDLDPSYALAHAGLGQAYWAKYLAIKDRQWIDLAWRECQRSIELGPELAEPHVTLALLKSGTGQYDDAVREARQAIQIDPRNDRAYSELARASEATGNLREAELTMKKAIEVRPSYWYNYARLGMFYANQAQYKEAETYFMRVIDLVPDNPVGYTDLGSVYHLEGRESEAEAMLKKSLAVRPTPHAYSNLATVYFFERRYAEALPIMEKLVTDATKEYLQWGNLGDAYRWTGHAEEATRAYRKAIALASQEIEVNPHDATALSSMALYCAKLGWTARSLSTLEKALTAAPDDTNILFDAAIISEVAGQRARALNFIKQAIRAGYSPHEIATEPELSKLRQDPRYRAAMADTIKR